MLRHYGSERLRCIYFLIIGPSVIFKIYNIGPQQVYICNCNMLIVESTFSTFNEKQLSKNQLSNPKLLLKYLNIMVKRKSATFNLFI